MSVAPEPQISVVVPVYNGASYVGEAIESALRQTHAPLEVIAVDDGSTDTSPLVLREFGAAVRVVTQPNRGTGAARNRGVETARGTLLAFLDQDDVWEPRKLEVQLAEIHAQPRFEAVFGMVRQFHSPELGDDFRHRVPCSEVPIVGYLPSAMLLKRESFERIGRFGETWQLVEWTEWFVRAIELDLAIRVVPNVVARRRLHEGNKGLALRSFQNEYPRILKALLDRRRSKPS